MTTTKSRVIQYVAIILLTATIGGGYWYWKNAQAGLNFQSSQEGTLSNGLVGYWPFDGNDISGTSAIDRSGQGNNGTLTNGPTVTEGRSGQGLSFNGSNQYATVPDSAALDIGTATTFSVWVKPTTTTFTGGSAIVFRKWSSGAEDKYVSLTDGGNIGFYLYNAFGGSELIATSSFSANAWTHIVGRYDGSVAEIYANGIKVASKSASGDVADGAGVLTIGRNPDGLVNYFPGSIDEPRIYNRALSASEIWDLYQLGNPDHVNSADSQIDSLEKGMVGYWKLDDASGTSATDSSGNGNTGTLTNGPTWTTGQIGGAVDFDGTNDYIDSGTGSSLNVGGTNLTISAWAKKTTGTDGVMNIVNRGQSGVGGYNFGIGVNTCGAHSMNMSKLGVVHICVGSFPQDTNWHHVVAVWNSSGQKIYVDGVVSGTDSNNQSFNAAYSGSLKIGMDYDGTSSPFKGSLDEVRIYNRALSADEVAKLYKTTAPDDPDTGLVGYWPFDGNDISGTTAYDRSTGGNNGTLTNGPTVTEGRSGQALSFNGTSQYTTITNNGSLGITNTLSLSAWVKPSTLVPSADMTILRKYDGASGDNYGLVIGGGNDFSQGKIGFTYNNGGWRLIDSGYTLSNAGWHHIVSVFDYPNTSVRFYDNGVLVATKTISYNLVTNSGALEIGRAYSSGKYFNGSIDEPRIYNRALSASEIWNLYQLGVPDKVNSADSQGDSLEKGMVGYWKLDDASGTSASDASGNANTGTLTNGPTWTTGQIGGATTFDGTDDYISVGNSNFLNLTNNFSVSLWLKINNTTQTDYKRAFGRYHIDDNNRPFYIEYDYNTNKYQGIWRNAGTYGSAWGGAVTSTQWKHFVVTFKDGIAISYDDGVKSSYSSSVVQPPSSSTNTQIGSINAGADKNFPGSIDEVRVYNRALSADEVAKLYKTTAPDDPDTGLVGYWSFNGPDLSGTTAYDRSGKGNNGTLTNGPTVTEGKSGQGMNFDGSNDYIAYGARDFGSIFTISLWVNPSSTGPSSFSDTLVANASSGCNVNGFRYFLNTYDSNDGKIIFETGNGSACDTAATPAGTITNNQWNHLVVVVNKTSGTATIYKDGVIVNSADTSIRVDFQVTSAWNLGVNVGCFKGSIDEPRIYNRALTQAEVTALYNAGR
jgi:hypothetical protein